MGIFEKKQDKIISFWKSTLFQELEIERGRIKNANRNIELLQYHSGRAELLEELLGWKVDRPNPFNRE